MPAGLGRGDVGGEAGGLPGVAVFGDRVGLVARQGFGPVAGAGRAHREGGGGVGVGQGQRRADHGEAGQADGRAAEVRVDDVRAAFGDPRGGDRAVGGLDDEGEPAAGGRGAGGAPGGGGGPAGGERVGDPPPPWFGRQRGGRGGCLGRGISGGR